MFRKLAKSAVLSSVLMASSVFAQTEGQIDVIEASDTYQPVVNYASNGGLDDKIVELADSLLASSRIAQNDMGNIAITSFVDLHNLKRTTSFGRTLGETFFNELFIRGFNVADFRGQNALSVNTTGEFFITRDPRKIGKKVANTYVLVGTFTTIDGKVLINARIMDNTTGKVVASAKSYYKTKDCRVIGNCPKARTIRIVAGK